MGRTLQPEDNIAQYRVIGPLGAGGMGEVYLAHDTTLERDVALKVLPAELVRSEDRVMRFVMEAKSASSLSHPHIVAIYEIGHEKVRQPNEDEPTGDEVHYIAMELINGKTVGDLIHNENTDLKTMLRYLAQSAEGLSKAHAAGIVHRDLKPGNIMVTNDGYAKILDFGLAKLTEKASSDAELTSAPTEIDRTSPGVLVGTVAYMSPEQAQGKSVDNRSDIFSFGCILYETATRARPFAADSSIDMMHKIVHDNPTPVDELNPKVPAELRRVIKRCLAKNPDQRLQSIKDLAIELREIVDEFDSLSATATSSSGIAQAPPVTRRSPVATTAVAAIVVLGIAGLAFGIWSMLGTSATDQDFSGRPFQSTRMSSLLSDNNIFGATLSDDGRYLAYIKGPVGQWSLWVRQVVTGSDVQILPQQSVPIRGVNFSPDGNYLYYLGRDTQTPAYSALYKVPSLGGAPRKRIFDIDSAITFSPDGGQVAFIRGLPNLSRQLIVFDLATETENILGVAENPDEIHFSKPGWSPDGARIAVAWHEETEEGTFHSLVAFDVSDGSREEITEPAGPGVESLVWLPDGSGLIATIDPLPGSPSQVFFLPYPKGERRQITNDLSGYNEVSLTADSASIAALRISRDSNLWIASNSGGDSRPLTSSSSTEEIEDIQPLHNGSILFSARKDRNRVFWVVNGDGTGRRQITSQAGWVWEPRLFADRKSFLFNQFSDSEDLPHVWRVDIDGGNLKQVTTGTGEFLVDVSPDGTTILYTTRSTTELWRRPIDGGEPVKVLTDFNFPAIYSPDGRLLLYTAWREIDGRQKQVWPIMPAEGGDPIATIDVEGQVSDLKWMPDSTGVTYVATAQDGVQNLSQQSLNGGRTKQITTFAEGRIHNIEYSPDGSMIAIERSIDGNENMWIIEANGGNARPVTDEDGHVFEAIWTLDNSGIFASQGTIRREVVMITESQE